MNRLTLVHNRLECFDSAKNLFLCHGRVEPFVQTTWTGINGYKR